MNPLLQGTVEDYIDALRIPELRHSSILLSGSAGWGIAEGMDEKADWDIHVILNDADHQALLRHLGNTTTLDDSAHRPPVFIQLRNTSWLTARLASQEKRMIYLWAYLNGTWIRDHLDISDAICRAQDEAFASYPEICREEFVRFSVRRLDTCSSAKRNLPCASRIYAGEMVQSALRAFCLFNRSPYPYNKWLPKYVESMGESGVELVAICEECLASANNDSLIRSAKKLKKRLENEATLIFGHQRWISHWWEFNEN